MAPSVVWGLDIGNSAIKAVKMQRVGEDCEIVDFDIVDIVHSDDDKDRTQRVSAALATLVQNKRFGSDPVFVSLPGNLCLFKEFKLPPGSEKKAADLVQYEAKQQVPFSLEEAEWGYELFEADEGQLGVEMIVVKKEIIRDVLAQTDNFRLNVRGISVAPLSIYNFIKYEFDPQQTVLVLDSGARGTDFVAMSGRHLYFRTLPVGGREISRVLENKFKMTFDKAEKLKKELKEQKQAEKILGVLEPSFRSLAAEVQRSIGFYKSRRRGARVDQVYLLGHTFRLPTMAEFLAGQVREAPFQIVAGLQRIRINPGINLQIFLNEFPTLPVAIGLGLQGLGVSELRANLVPAERRAEMELASKRGWAVAAAAILLVTLGISYHRANVRRDTLTVLSTNLKKAADMVQVEQDKYEKARTGAPEMEQKILRWTRMAHDRGKALQVLSKLAELRRESDNRKFFGLPDPNPNVAEPPVRLTGLYVSRTPMTQQTIGAVPPPNEFAPRIPAERSALKEVWSGDGTNPGLYSPMANASFQKLPYELQPDLPFLVAISCEVPAATDNTRAPVMELEAALKKVEGFTHVKIAQENRNVSREEAEKYDVDEKGGQPKDATKMTPRRISRQYLAFMVTFRYNPRDDQDIAPK